MYTALQSKTRKNQSALPVSRIRFSVQCFRRPHDANGGASVHSAGPNRCMCRTPEELEGVQDSIMSAPRNPVDAVLEFMQEDSLPKTASTCPAAQRAPRATALALRILESAWRDAITPLLCTSFLHFLVKSTTFLSFHTLYRVPLWIVVSRNCTGRMCILQRPNMISFTARKP